MGDKKNINPPERIAILYAEVQGHRGYLLRFAVAKLRDTGQAEEVVQEALAVKNGKQPSGFPGLEGTARADR